MQAHHTSVSESSSSPIPDESLLRTPIAGETAGGAVAPEVARAKGQTLRLSGQMIDMVAPDQLPKLPTPLTSDARVNGSEGAMARKSPQISALVHSFLPTAIATDWKNGKSSEGFGMNLSETAKLFPTPAVSDNKGAARSEVEAGDPKHRLKVAVELLPTTRTSMANGASQKELEAGNPKFRIEAVTNWGKFEPAIKRWERVIERKAPAPTKPDGKDGNHRLSSKFTEWMMGLPEGWITEVGLTRNEELKACGNGVVPQQAELALRILLEGVDIELPTTL